MRFQIEQYDPTVFPDDQPWLQIRAMSGNEYVAQYDPESGYFFTDEIIAVVDETLVAQEIPGRIYEPLSEFDIYRFPGYKYTVAEILAATPLEVTQDYAPQSLAEVINELIPDANLDAWDLPQHDLVIEEAVVVDVDYDGRRGARTSYFTVAGVPCLVHTRAGRELDDRSEAKILNRDLIRQVIDAFRGEIEFPEDIMADPETPMTLVFWEGCPVKLGDRFWGTERPDSGRDD